MALQRCAFLALILAGFFGTASAQTIDCADKALNNSDAAVCASSPLHALDVSIEKKYQHLAHDPAAQQSQREWASRRDRCNASVACLDAVYSERSAHLDNLLAADKLTAARSPLKAVPTHLFLRHAPAQLLLPPAPGVSADATDHLNRAAGPVVPVRDTTHWNPIWFVSVVMMVALLLWQILTNVCGKCPSCHHWFARTEVDQRHFTVDQAELPRRRGWRPRLRGASSSMSSQPVHRPVALVRHYNQCRMCLHEWETTSPQTK